MDWIRKPQEASVYHSTVPLGGHAKYDKPPYFPKYYEEVARIAVVGLPELPTLEEYERECDSVRMRTMHLERDWRENPGVRVITTSEKVRSTEIGDVIAFDNGRTFRSQFRGWLEIVPDRRPEPRMSQRAEIEATPRWETPKGTSYVLDKRELFPEEVARTIPRIGEQDLHSQKEWIVYARIGPPDRSWSTYVMELNPEGLAFAVRRDHQKENSRRGIFDIHKIEGPVGRDPSWRPEVFSMIPMDWQGRELGRSRGLELTR